MVVSCDTSVAPWCRVTGNPACSAGSLGYASCPCAQLTCFSDKPAFATLTTTCFRPSASDARFAAETVSPQPQPNGEQPPLLARLSVTACRQPDASVSLSLSSSPLSSPSSSPSQFCSPWCSLLRLDCCSSHDCRLSCVCTRLPHGSAARRVACSDVCRAHSAAVAC